MKYFLCVIGLIFVIEGIPYFAFPEKMKFIMSKVQVVPESTLRILGLLAMITGLVLVYFGTNG